MTFCDVGWRCVGVQSWPADRVVNTTTCSTTFSFTGVKTTKPAPSISSIQLPTAQRSVEQGACAAPNLSRHLTSRLEQLHLFLYLFLVSNRKSTFIVKVVRHVVITLSRSFHSLGVLIRIGREIYTACSPKKVSLCSPCHSSLLVSFCAVPNRPTQSSI